MYHHLQQTEILCSAHTMHSCILHGSQNKQPLFLCTAFNLLVFITEAECLLRGTNWVFKSDSCGFVFKTLRGLTQKLAQYTQILVSLCWLTFHFMDTTLHWYSSYQLGWKTV